MPSFFSVMSIQQDCLASSFRVFFVTIFLHSFFRSLFDPMESAPTQLGEPGSIVRSSHKPLNDENEKLSLYKQVCIIGLCKQGDVRFCRVEDDNSQVAMKVIHKCLVPSEDDAKKLCSQLNHLMTLSHPFILNTRDIFQDEKKIYIISDFCSGGNLYSMLQTFGQLNESHVQFIAAQLILALRYLHEKNCIFCNLIAENVLIDNRGFVHLTGFGHTLFDVKKPYYGVTGFTECLSPEMLLNKGIDESHDYWMLGCLLYELLEGHLPFQGDTVSDTLQAILVCKVSYKHATPVAQQFINSFLTSRPSKRLGRDFRALQNHEFLKGVDWKNLETL
ncbi:hypothetical protein WA171_005397, partial [Blastocystis sp. BT1]